MPLQNRVDPFGKLHAVEARGAWMGNRGILHDSDKRIVRNSRSTAWITCQLAFKGRQLEVFGAGTYSQLFFLDEATAFAAGHRPCGECRRPRYLEFVGSWERGNAGRYNAPGSPADRIDRVLHQERRLPRPTALLGSLPDGTFVNWRGVAHLVWRGTLLTWSFSGYGVSESEPDTEEPIPVLTPMSCVRAFSTGLLPQAHESVVSTGTS